LADGGVRSGAQAPMLEPSAVMIAVAEYQQQSSPISATKLHQNIWLLDFPLFVVF
jgi:hypothetical protein